MSPEGPDVTERQNSEVVPFGPPGVGPAALLPAPSTGTASRCSPGSGAGPALAAGVVPPAAGTRVRTCSRSRAGGCGGTAGQPGPRRGHGEGAGGTAHGALRTGRGVPTRGPQARTRCCWPPALRPPPGEHTAGTGTPFKTACPVSAGLPASRGRLVCSRSRAWGVKRVPPFAAAGPWALTCWEAGRVTGCRLGGGRPCPIPGSTRGGTLGHPAPPSGPGLHLPWSGSRLSPRTCSRNCRPLPAPSPGQALLPPFPCGRSGCALPLSQGHPSRSPCEERAGVSGQEGPQQRMALPGRAAVGGRGA